MSSQGSSSPNLHLSSLADIASASGHIGYSWDLETGHITWLGGWQRFFNLPAEGLPLAADSFRALVSPEDQASFLDDCEDNFDRVYRLSLSGGAPLWVREHGRILREDGRPKRREALLCAIEDPERLPAVSAHADALTGRPNRAALQEQIGLLITTPRKTNLQPALMVVAIERMGFINEALGLSAANFLLCEVGRRLQALCGTDVLMGRMGGDSFGIVLTGDKAADVADFAARILSDFHDRAIVTPAAPLHITLSLGSAVLTPDIRDPVELMIRAEQAQHQARNKGRHEYAAFLASEDKARESRAILDISEKVKTALHAGGLHLAYQPVVDAQTGSVIFYEALARLMRDDGTLIPAADFIPVVEQQGLAPEFDRYVLDLALKDLEAHDDLRLAVNISGLTAALTDWPEYIQSLLAPRPDVAQRLIIEITETAAIMDVAETRLLTDSIKEMGGQVALDDFGAGSTSIRHLRNLSLAIMKIDKDLLINLLTSVEQQHLVRMLIRIAHGLNLKTVVEGIETQDVAEWLRLERADMLQGYYFGYPTLDRPWDKKEAKEETTKTTSSAITNAPPAPLSALANSANSGAGLLVSYS